VAEIIAMPKLGFDMAEGLLSEWVKKAGDPVAEGETIAIIETDKASVEVPSFRAGVLHQILVQAGNSVPIGTPIAVIGNPGETVDLAALGVTPATSLAVPEAPGKAVQPPVAAEEPVVAGPEAPGTAQGGRLAASPVALHMAAELGIDMRQVKGTGPDGRIIKRDIEEYVKVHAGPPAKVPATPILTPSSEPTAEGYRSEPLSPMRQTIGRRMVESKQQAPHFYITMDVDMAAAMALRAQLNGLLAEDEKISVNDLVTKAAAVALRQFPNINASFASNEIRILDHINIGIAVAREAGLLTVVIRDCDRKSLAQIARDARDLINHAREGRMKADDMVGGTFTISNLGMFDVEDFIAIINPPQAAILAVGAVKRVPVVDPNGQLAVGTRMKMTISADHRVTDGAEAARFLQSLRTALEEPMRLVL